MLYCQLMLLRYSNLGSQNHYISLIAPDRIPRGVSQATKTYIHSKKTSNTCIYSEITSKGSNCASLDYK